MAGSGDFNGDGWTDILWRNENDGQNSIWIMNGVTYDHSVPISNAPDNPDVVACAVGDFDNDGYPDIVVRHVASGQGYSTGETAIWFMTNTVANGPTIREGRLLVDSTGTNNVVELDLDWKVVGTGDFDRDGHPDIYWRHATLGQNYFYFMNGHTNLLSHYLLPPIYDTDWRMASQDTADSTWRLDRVVHCVRPTISASSADQAIVLTWSYDLPTGATYTVQRRVRGETQWTTWTGITSPTFTEYPQPGVYYEYRVFSQQGQTQGPVAPIFASAAGAAIHNRGRLVLLVDSTLAPSLSAELNTLTQDLVGDGWTVIRHDVSRHNDSTWSANTNNIATIKNLVVADYNAAPADTKGVLIIGHVSIPYSGYTAYDGHDLSPGRGPWDHRGAWPSDLYYGLITNSASIFTDSGQERINLDFEANSQRRPNGYPDGKFDQDILTGYVQRIQLFVGRVDFAQMPTVGLGEIPLLQRYFSKDHKYRHKISPFPLSQRAVTYGHWNVGLPAGASCGAYGDPYDDPRNIQMYRQAVRNSTTLFGSQSDKLLVGDPFLQRTRGFMWGFTSGPGAPDRINWNYPGGLEHTTVNLQYAGNEPQIGFYLLCGSYFGDWMCRRDGMDNFLRGALATANYGLASIWAYASDVSLAPLGVGEPLGAAMVYTHNECTAFIPSFTAIAMRSIMGDPTLRLHTLQPASGLSATPGPGSVALSWSPSETGAQYYAYRNTNSLYGPYSVLAGPLAGTSYTDNAPPSGQKFYMVRAVKTVSSASGTYANLSQGVFVTVNP
jgi:hypothetical protein